MVSNPSFLWKRCLYITKSFERKIFKEWDAKFHLVLMN